MNRNDLLNNYLDHSIHLSEIYAQIDHHQKELKRLEGEKTAAIATIVGMESEIKQCLQNGDSIIMNGKAIARRGAEVMVFDVVKDGEPCNQHS